MKRFYAIVLLVWGCLAVPAWAQPAGQDFSGILFPNPDGGQFGYGIVWARTPTAEAVRAALPPSVHVEGRTEWDCGVGADGGLNDCRLQVAWPSDPVYEQAGRKLLDQFVLSEASARAARSNHARAKFSLIFWGDGLVRPDVKDCPPLFCTPVPPPPPPPK